MTALAGTGSQLAITAFQRTARELIGYEPVTTGDLNDFFAQINGRDGPAPNAPLGYNPESPPRAASPMTQGPLQPGPTGRSLINATNWDDALEQVNDVAGGPPNLVVFITDGDPTTYNTAATRPPVGTNINTATPALTGTTFANSFIHAVNSANGVKEHSRIFAIGVGPAAGTTAAAQDSRLRLQHISGPNEFTGGEHFAESDWTALQFDQLETRLREAISDLCGGSATVTKRVLDHNGDLVPDVPAANGWPFETTLSPQERHTWVSPAHDIHGGTTGPTARRETGDDGPGIARFEWTLRNTSEHVSPSIRELEKPGSHGFNFVSGVCHNTVGGVPDLPHSSTAGIPASGPLGPDDFRTCEVINKQHAATLDVVKRVVPNDDPGEFNLLVNGQEKRVAVAAPGGSTGPITLPLATHTVSETAASGTDLADYDTTIECVDSADGDRVVVPEHTARSVHVPLVNQGEAIVCIITNTSLRDGQITVVKHLIPHGDSARFNLLADGHTVAHHVGDGGHGSIRLPFGTHAVTEHGASGTNLGHFHISTRCIDENTGDEVAHNAHGPSVSVHLTRESDQIQCTIQNERPGVKVGRLEVVKHLVPQHAGLFNLLIGGTAFALGVGHHGTTGPLDFELGRHAVTEHGVHGTQLADFAKSTTCVDRAHGNRRIAHNAHGPAVSVDLNSESDNIVCTITNRLNQPPPENGGEAPVPPDAAPHLAVAKRMPPHAQVGEFVPISVVVHNHGRGTAYGVHLTEQRPAGLRIVHVADGGTIAHGGSAVWHFGSLAPGASRTVHATARVLRTGLHVDTAVATALNADPALSDAAVRARAAAARPHPTPPRHRHPKRPPPRFTG